MLEIDEKVYGLSHTQTLYDRKSSVLCVKYLKISRMHFEVESPTKKNNKKNDERKEAPSQVL